MAVGGTRQKLSMIATVTNQGKARWMIIDGTFNHERLIEFFESLVKDTGKKIPDLGQPGGPSLQAGEGSDGGKRDHMTALETKPERIKPFFQDPFVEYAA